MDTTNKLNTTLSENSKNPLSLKIGSRIENYEILSLIGKGGMGVVYKAKDIHLNRVVAIKFIIGSGGVSNRMIKRFHQEAHIYASLSHPNIVKLYTMGEYNKNPYMVIEYIDGVDLKKYLKDKTISIKAKVEILEKISDALGYVHQYKIVHRDIKPSNIMMRKNGDPVVMDFGIARLNSENKAMSKTGDIIGSPNYMSPEQAEARKRDINEQTDVYALGGVLYYLLTGNPPAAGTSMIKVIFQVTNIPPIPPCSIDAKIPTKLEEICMTALEKKVKTVINRQKILEMNYVSFLLEKVKQRQNISKEKNRRCIKVTICEIKNPYL